MRTNNITVYKGAEILFYSSHSVYIVYDREFDSLGSAKAFITSTNKQDAKIEANLKCIDGGRWFKGFPIAQLRVIL